MNFFNTRLATVRSGALLIGPLVFVSSCGLGTNTDLGATPDTVAPKPLSCTAPAIDMSDGGVNLVETFQKAHGPTDNITNSVAPLFCLPEVPTPAGSHIVSMSYDGNLCKNDERRYVGASVEVMAGETIEDATSLFGTGFTNDGWTVAQPEWGDVDPNTYEKDGHKISLDFQEGNPETNSMRAPGTVTWIRLPRTRRNH